MEREDRIFQEARELWCELYGEAPPADADGSALLELITRRMPQSGYSRLVSPHLRKSTIAMPKRAGA